MQPIVSCSTLAHDGHEVPEVELCGPRAELNHGRETRFLCASGTGQAFSDDGGREIGFEIPALGLVGVAKHLHGRVAEDGPRVSGLRQALPLHGRQGLDLVLVGILGEAGDGEAREPSREDVVVPGLKFPSPRKFNQSAIGTCS